MISIVKKLSFITKQTCPHRANERTTVARYTCAFRSEADVPEVTREIGKTSE